MLVASVNSASFFAPHWLCWKMLGATPKKVLVKNINWYRVHAVVVNFIVTFGYPFHLCMMLFRNGSAAENMKNLSAVVIVLASCSKFVIYATKLNKVEEVLNILKELDARVISLEDRNHFKRLRRTVGHMTHVFLVVYFAFGITATLSLIFKGGHDTLFPAWFPFDWRKSGLNYFMACAYQVVGMSGVIMQNFCGDTFSATALCLLSGHTELLGIRLRRIGYDEKSQSENEEELQRCIVDQKKLYNLFDTIQEIISPPSFVQLVVTAVNMSGALGSLLFFVNAPMDRLFYCIYFIAMPFQIFPTCYFGNETSLKFAQLHRDIYASNWVFQSRSFRKTMIIFTERSLADSTPMAGGVVQISLATSVATCRAAYSLFAILIQFAD